MIVVLDKKELSRLFDYLSQAYKTIEETIANDDGKPSLLKKDYFIPALDINQIH
jgi:hypothetical protein